MESKTTDREDVAELIHYWPLNFDFKSLTERQRRTITHMEDDAGDKFKRDSSPVVDLCDCKQANIFHFGEAPKHDKYNPDAGYLMVRTQASTPGTCDFCGYATKQVRESALTSDGTFSNRRVPKAVRAVAKAKQIKPHEEFRGARYFSLQVVDSYLAPCKVESRNGRQTRMLKVKCDCGTNLEIRAGSWERTKSCGCKAYENHGNKKKRRKAREVTNV